MQISLRVNSCRRLADQGRVLEGVAGNAFLCASSLWSLYFMGIEFKEVKDDERKMLRDFVKRVSAQDILESRKGTGIRSDNAKH